MNSKKKLYEHLAVFNENNIIALGRQIYSDLLPVIKSSVPTRHKTAKTYDINIFGEDISVEVNFPAPNNWCYYVHQDRKLIINVHTGWSQNIFLKMFLHEMTHAIDRIKQYKGYTYGNGYFRFSQQSSVLDDINEILYRLWSMSERRAYQSISVQGLDAVNQYIQYMSELINRLDTRRKTKYDEKIWSYVMNEIPSTPIRYKNNWVHFKKYFIKKSYWLLSKFTKECKRNIGYVNGNPIGDVGPNANSPFIEKIGKANSKTEIDQKLVSLGKRLISIVWDTDYVVDKDPNENWWVIERMFRIPNGDVNVRITKDSYQEEVTWEFPEWNGGDLKLSSLNCDYYENFYENNIPSSALRKLGKLFVELMKINGVDTSEYIA